MLMTSKDGHTEVISKTARRILEQLKSAEDVDDLDNAEIVCEGRVCYVGLYTVSKAAVYELLRVVLISDDSDQGGCLERYSLNEEGRAMVNNPNYIPQIVKILAERAAEAEDINGHMGEYK